MLESLRLPWPAWFTAGLAGLLIIIHSHRAPAQQDAEDRTLQEMCRHGLAETAILYVTAQLERTLDASLQAKWTMRLMECHAQAALRNSAGADEHWARCSELLTQFAERQPMAARLPWLAWQAARCRLLQAQSAFARYLAAPAAVQLREEALVAIRELLRQAEDVLDDIKRRQPVAARQSVNGGSQAPVEQLHQLEVDVALLQCEALLVRGQLYEAGSPDRVAAMTEVDTRASAVLSRTADDWSAREQLRVAQAIAHLELGRSSQALLALQKLASESLNSQVRIRAAVTAIETLAAMGDVSRAQPLLLFLAQAGAGPELALAKLQLALAEIPGKTAAAKQQALSELVAGAQQIGRQYGAYWRNRAEALLVGSVSSTSLDSNTNGQTGVAVELKLVEIRQLLASGDTAGAIAKLLQFRDNEAAVGRGQTAIQLAAQASALLQRERQWAAAIDAIEPVVLKFSNSTGAAEAHLLVIWSRSEALRSDPRNQQLAAAYQASLRQQLTTWPDAVASHQAETWLATWLIGQDKRAELVEVMQARAMAARDAAVARQALTGWLEQVLQLTDRAKRQLRVEALRQAVVDCPVESTAGSASLAALVADTFSTWPASDRAQAMRAELSQASRVTSDELDRQLGLAAELLMALRASQLGSLPNLSSQWQPNQLTPALRIGLTPALIEAIDETPITAHRSWFDGLKVEQTWIDDLTSSPQPLEQALGFRLLTWKQNPTVGLEGLAQLTQKFPRDGNLQLQLAHMLAESGPNRLADSTRIAKQLAASSAVGSELNLAARWRIINNQMLAGENAAAQQAAQLLLATQPQLGEVWRQRFESVSK